MTLVIALYLAIPTSTLAKFQALSERPNVLRAKNVNTLRYVLELALTCYVTVLIKCEVFRVNGALENRSARLGLAMTPKSSR